MSERKRPPFWHSLYGRISALYLLLSLSLALLCGWVAVHHFRLFVNEVEQKLHRELAAKLVAVIDGPLRHGHYPEAVAQAVEQTTMFFPALELYVLDDRGRILESSVAEADLGAQTVPLDPVGVLLQPDAMLPVWGADPRRGGERKVFSAAPVVLADGAAGYLYVVLRGAAAGSAESMLQNSYLMRALPLFLMLTLALTVVVGLFVFALLTRRFRQLTESVLRFKEGDLSRRLTVPGQDEIGQLGRAFNDMAATIEGQVEVLRETDARRRALVANISHDFRTPLTSIRGHAERLQARGDSLAPAVRDASLEAIVLNAEQLERLSTHLDELSRLDAGTLEPHSEPFPLDELVQDVLLKWQPQAEDWRVELVRRCTAERVVAFADIGLVERLLSNLLHNALQNTPTGGRVTVGVERAGARLRMQVADTGRGIPADAMPLVQQRFFRLRRPPLHGGNGSGLGLSIAQEIAGLHGSTLHLESREGEGTTVSFDLPATQ